MSKLFTPIGLTSVFVWNSLRKVKSPNQQKIKMYEQALLAVATVQYVITWSMTDTKQIMTWRYLDWIITTPLLLKTVHLFAVEKGYSGSIQRALSGNVLMILSGFLAENAKTFVEAQAWNLIGFVGFALVLTEVNKWIHFLMDKGVQKARWLKPFFYLGWTGYGLNQFNKFSELRQTIFNVLDFINKGVFTVVLNFIMDDAS